MVLNESDSFNNPVLDICQNQLQKKVYTVFTIDSTVDTVYAVERVVLLLLSYFIDKHEFCIVGIQNQAVSISYGQSPTLLSSVSNQMAKTRNLLIKN